MAVATAGGPGPRGQVFFRGVMGHPLTPFVVGDEGNGDDEDGENAEENLHDAFRIAQIRRLIILR